MSPTLDVYRSSAAMRTLRVALLALIGCCNADGSRVHGQQGPAAIGINIIGGITPNPASSVTGIAGAFPQGNWNNIAPAGPGEIEDEFDFVGTTAGTTLVDGFGSPTSLVVAWEGEESYRAGTPATADQDDHLMDGYLDVDDSNPRSSIFLSGIPYPAYDLYVYVGSDGNGRTAFLDIDNGKAGDEISAATTQVWFVTSTGGNSFAGAADYRQATARTAADAAPSNFIVYPGLRDASLTVSVNRGTSGGNPNAGIHGLQIVQQVAPLVLRVDTRTGNVSIVGVDAIPVAMNGYEIRAASGRLRADRHRSLQSQRIDAVDGPADQDETLGTSTGETWEVVLANLHSIVEGFLFGSTQVDGDTNLRLGALLDPVDALEGGLEFAYTLTSGLTYQGVVEYFVSQPDEPSADFDENGQIDGRDLLAWQRGFGVVSAAVRTDGDANGDGQVDQRDYALWLAEWGMPQALGPGFAAVPEPSFWGMLVCLMGGLSFKRTRHGVR